MAQSPPEEKPLVLPPGLLAIHCMKRGVEELNVSGVEKSYSLDLRITSLSPLKYACMILALESDMTENMRTRHQEQSKISD